MVDFYYPLIGGLLVAKIIFWVCFCAVRNGAFRDRNERQRRCTVIRVDSTPRQIVYPQNPYTARSAIVDHEVPPGQSYPGVPPGGAPVQPPAYDDASKPGINTISNDAMPPDYNQAVGATYPSGAAPVYVTMPNAPVSQGSSVPVPI